MSRKVANVAKRLGLDIGIASIGYAVIENDENTFNGKLLDLGVRVFTAAEQPKTGASLALPRREARSARRRLARRSGRLYNIRKLLLEKNFITQAEIEDIHNSCDAKTDVWDLRKEALDRKLNNKEFYRILIHIAKRRGFKSIRKSEEAKTEGDLLKSIKNITETFEESKYRTIGEMFAVKYTNGEPKRNKAGKYNKSVSRDLLKKEIEIIFEAQRKFGSQLADKDIETKYKEIAFYQRPLKTIEIKASCTFEPSEKRAPKCAYTSEIFIALNKLVNLRLMNNLGDTRFLSAIEIKNAIDLAHKLNKVTYKQLRKELDIDDDIKFLALNYGKKDSKGQLTDVENSTLIELKNYHAVRKAIENNPKLGKTYFEAIKNDEDFFNTIAYILTREKTDENIEKALRENGYSDEIVESIKELSMSKTSHLSIKAMKKLIPFMLQGMKYSEACKEAGYDIKNKENKKQSLLPVLNPEELTTNPVVNRAISQTRKVVNALIKKHGYFDNIIIEMSRDLSKSANERREIKKAQDDFQAEKERARQRCIEHGLNPDCPKSNLLKFRLWEEQGEFCVYSNKQIDPKRLSEPDYVDIDHIIPYSRSFDDSINNKVLVLTDENRRKGSKIPYEYIGEDKWHEFVQRIKSYHLKQAKINRLIKKKYEQEGFKSRNLNDTRYIAKFVKDYIKENLDFDNDLKVETRNGSLTAFLRTQWGLIKNRDESDKHHALDAAVIACSTQGMVQFLSTISAKLENYDYIKNQKPRFKKPWETFSYDLEERLKNVFVSRAARKSVKGQLHDETIRSAKHLQEGFTTIKKPITEIDLKTLEQMFDKERNYKIFNLLKERLEQFNNDPKKAFSEPVYMPISKEKTKNGQLPHEIKSIKIKDSSTSGVLVRNGFAKNASMPRLDIFTKKNRKGKNEFFLVPIYVSDFGKELPNKAISRSKNGWIEMTKEYEFLFSLFPDTLIAINPTGKPEDEFLGYYKSCDISSGKIIIDSPDRSIKEKGFGTKTAAYIKKYQVEILGDYHEVKCEKRLPIKMKGKEKHGVQNSFV